MKQRVITALVGLAILFTILAFYMTPVLPIAAALLTVFAVYEALHALGCLEAKLFSYSVMAAAAAIVVAPPTYFFTHFSLSTTVGALALLFLWLRYHGRYTAEKLGFAAGISVLIAMSLRCFVLMRDLLGYAEGFYALLVTFTAAWMSDTGGYFAGRWFGKHKLCPHISPKKTVEGAIGGIVFAAAGLVILNLIVEHFIGRPIVLAPMLIASPLLTAISIMGDLSASVIKRDAGLKDYGNLFPGHGGVLDRFDSVLPLAPVVYLLFYYFL